MLSVQQRVTTNSGVPDVELPDDVAITSVPIHVNTTLGLEDWIKKPFPKLRRNKCVVPPVGAAILDLEKADRADFTANHIKYKPPAKRSEVVQGVTALCATVIQYAVSNPHNSEPQSTPNTLIKPYSRPNCIEVVAICTLAGPGVAAIARKAVVANISVSMIQLIRP